ncbi:Peptidase family S41 [Bacillus sp. B-jedd]|nr:Peptidase family S41 [Bacillus sp. B-jedd]
MLALVTAGIYYMPEKQAELKVKKTSVDRTIENVEAFGRLYGYVRYFHPSDEAASLDWNRFGIFGVSKVKSAQNEKELKTALEELFLPIAPTLSLYLEGEKPPKKSVKKTDAVIAWQHHGPPGMYGSLYKSKRVPASIVNGGYAFEEGSLFADYPQLEEKYYGKLGKSLRFSLPLILYTDNGQTLGTTKKSWKAYENLKVELAALNSGLTSESDNFRYAGVVSTWNMLEHFFPSPYLIVPFYPSVEENALHLDGQLAISLREAADAKGLFEYVNVLSRLMEKTGDVQASYSFLNLTKDTRRMQFSLDFVEDKVVVTEASLSPILRLGDVLHTINGVEVNRYVDSLSETIPGPPHFKKWRALDAILDLDQAEVTYSRNGEKNTVKLGSDSYGVFSGLTWKNPYKDLGNGVYYINLATDAREPFHNNLNGLMNASGVIFDMRSPAYDDAFFEEIIGHLTEKPIVGPGKRIMQVIYPHRENATFVEKQESMQPVPPAFKGKAIFLVSSETIGQPELYLSSIKDHQLGTIVGQPTAGAFGDYQIYQIAESLRGTMTASDTLNKDRISIMSIGIQPDVLVERTLEGVAKGKDETLDMAIELLKGK